ncbi:MAG: Rrf2 family transcriptional regulator [Gammaproteobacteria bacterium]|nr:Rrf2 family transcriptional regulator [Gammaproteobacteria bacterium]
MRLTTKGRYAVTAMIDLALRDQGDPVSLADIATHQSISLSYLEQLFARLRTHGLVQGSRGPGGGYRLTRPAEEISVAQIIIASDEKLDVTRCHGKENCQQGKRCLTHDLWSELSDRLYEFLDGITLGELVKRPAVRAHSSQRGESRSEDFPHAIRVS